MNEHVERFWGIEYVNGHQWIGKVDSHWTLGDIGSAMLFRMEDEAARVRQAVYEEGADRIARKESVASQWWRDVTGGLLQVQAIEVVTRKVP